MAIKKKETIRQENLPPVQREEVKGVDFADKKGNLVGGYVRRGGRGGRITSVGGTVPQSVIDEQRRQQQAEEQAKQQAQAEQQARLEAERQRQTQVTNQQRQAVALRNQLPETFYYKSDLGLPQRNFRGQVVNQGGVQYFQTTEQGQVIRKLTPEEVKQYNLTPTKTLQASEEKRSVISKIQDSPIVRKTKQVAKKIDNPFGDPFENQPVIADPFPIIPAVPVASFVTKVRFVGFTQKANKGRLTTEAVYEATRKGFLYPTTELGVVKSESTFINIDRTSYSLVSSRGEARVFARERGGVVTYPQPPRVDTLEVGLFKRGKTGKLSLSATKGVQADRTFILPESPKYFESASLGLNRGEKITEVVGISSSGTKGTAYSRGLLKEIDLSDINFEAFPSGITPNQFQTLQGQALKSTISSIPPVKTSTTLPSTISVSSGLSQIQSQNLPTSIISTPKQTTKITQSTTQTQSLGLQTGQRTRQRSSSVLVNRQQERQLVSTLTSQGQQQNQKQNQMSSQVLRSLSLTRQQQRGLLKLINISGATRPSGFRFSGKVPRGFLFKLPKARKSKAQDVFGSKLFVKEKGKFKFAGLFETPKKATQKGVDITAKTINRSFKIVGGKVGVPLGYRRSRAKGQQNVFVERSTTALSQFGEQFTIQSGKRRKRK